MGGATETSTLCPSPKRTEARHDEQVVCVAVDGDAEGVEESTESPYRNSWWVRVLSIAFYYISSGALTLFNKWVLDSGKFGFHFPLSLTCWHQLCIFLFLWIAGDRLAPVAGAIRRGDTRLRRLITPIGILCAIDWGLSNASFNFISVSLYEMTKSASPLFVLLFAKCAGIDISPRMYPVVLMVSLGMVLSVSGTKSGSHAADGFHTIGFSLIAIATVVSGMRNVWMQSVMQCLRPEPSSSKPALSTTAPVNVITTLYYATPASAAVLALPAVYFEWSGITQWLEARGQTGNLNALITSEQGEFVLVLLGSTTLALFLSMSEFLVVRTTSALTLCVAGIFKQVVIIVAAMALYKEQVTLLSAVGFSITLSGIVLYNLTRASQDTR